VEEVVENETMLSSAWIISIAVMVAIVILILVGVRVSKKSGVQHENKKE